MKLRLPFVVMRRRTYRDALAASTQDGFRAGYDAGLEMRHEAAKSRKAVPKPKKARP